MTATRSAVSAITPMSCVISITAVPWSRHMRFSTEMICACTETSSAVVGSSAMTRSGSAAGDAARRVDQPDHGGAGHRLAGAGFAHHAKDLALVDVERDPVERLQNSTTGGELDREVAHGKNGGRHLSLGLRASRSQSPTR